jgi:60kDa lysophospholipase
MALASEESRVLLLYTGGTIGMLVSDAGYVPEPFFLFETLRSQNSRFHDPLGDSLLSRGRSVEGFREWSEGRSREQSKSRSRAVSRDRKDALEKSTSRRRPAPLNLFREGTPPVVEKDGERTPAVAKFSPLDDLQPSQHSSPWQGPADLDTPSTLLVRSTRPLTAPPLMEEFNDPSAALRGRPAVGALPRCKKVRENCYEMHLPSLVTPAASSAPGGNVKRIRYAVLEVRSLCFFGMVWPECFASGTHCLTVVIWRSPTGSE